MKKRLIFLLVIPIYSIGSDIIDFKNKLNKIMTPAPDHLVDDPCCNTQNTTKKNLYNQCAIDLCGPSGSYPSAWVTDETFDKYYSDAKVLKNFENFMPTMQKYLDIVFRDINKHANEVKNQIAKNLNYFNLDQFSDSDISSIIERELQNRLMVTIKRDKQGKKEFFIEFENENPKIPKEIRDQYLIHIQEKVNSDFLFAANMDYFTNSEAHAIALDAADELLIHIDKAISNFTTYPENYMDAKQELKEAKDDKKNVEKIRKSLSSTNKTDEFSDLSSYGFKYETDFSYLNSTNESFSCESNKCRVFTLEILKSTLNNNFLDKIIGETNNDKSKADLIQSCKFLWHTDNIHNKMENDIRKFKKKLPTIKDNISKYFLSQFSSESQHEIKKMLSKIHFSFDDEDDTSFLIKHTKNEIYKIIQHNGNDPDEYVPPYAKDVLLDYYRMSKHKYNNDIFMNHHLSICEEAEIKAADYAIVDSATKNIEEIYISSLSIQNPSIGEQIVTHELGHAINSIFSNNYLSKSSLDKYVNVRKCVAQRYKDKNSLSPPLKLFQFDTQYTEEDMADYISYQVFKSTNLPLQNCSMLRPANNKVDFDDRSLHVMNPVNNREHSTDILRLLDEAIYRNKELPESCKKVRDNYQHQINFNKCEFP